MVTISRREKKKISSVDLTTVEFGLRLLVYKTRRMSQTPDTLISARLHTQSLEASLRTKQSNVRLTPS